MPHLYAKIIPMKKLIYTLAFTFLFITIDVSAQCLIKHIPLNNKISNATHVIEGRVIDKVSFWDANNKNIYTRNKIEVYKIFKGAVQGNYIEIISEGGTIGNDMETVEPSLQLKIGETGIFACNYTSVNVPFSHTSSIPQFDAFASVQGFIKYDLTTLQASAPFETYSDISTVLYPSITSITNNNYQTVKKVNFTPSQVNQFQSGTSITSISPTTATAGTKTQLTIVGSLFGSTQGSGYVEFADNNSGGSSFYQPLASQYLYWDDDTIIVEIPSRAGTGAVKVTQSGTATSSQTLTLSYSQLNVTFDDGGGDDAYMPDHVNDNSSGGYTFQMYTGFDGNASAKASFLRALDTWRCNTGVNWTNGSTTAIDAIASDGVNVVRFDIGGELPGGVLGRCTSRWSGCGSPLKWYVTELDVVFDDGTSWEYGPALPDFTDYDFETVAVHELGHGHQLGHVISPGAIMHYSISNGSSNRSLGVNDLAGGNYVQSQSTAANACGPGAMTNYTCGSAPVANFSASSTSTCSGSAITFTDLSTNTPTSWSWVFQGGTPSTSTQQNPSITYNTPGVYNVTLTATNASGSDAEIKIGYISIGCSQLKSYQCGTTLPSLYTTLYAVKIQGVTNYEYRISNAALTYTVTHLTGNSAYFKLTSVSGIQPGVTYNIEVRVKKSGVWGDYGPTCQITTPGFPTPQIQGSFCGNTISSLNNYIFSVPVTGASNYEYRISNAPLSYTTTLLTGNSGYFKFSNIPSIRYGTTYNVEVRANIGGTWSGYGPSCAITTPAWPSAEIQSSFCGTTLSSINTNIYANNIPGAANYKFLITNSGLSYSDSLLIGNGGYFKLSSLSGIQASTTYTVQVKAKVGGEWSSYGSSCAITTPGSIIAPYPDNNNNGNISFESPDNNQQFYKNQENTTEELLNTELYPNPSKDGNVLLSLDNITSDEVVVLLYDISGREIYNKTIPTTPNAQHILPMEFGALGLPKGIYLVKVLANSNYINHKLIIE